MNRTVRSEQAGVLSSPFCIAARPCPVWGSVPGSLPRGLYGKCLCVCVLLFLLSQLCLIYYSQTVCSCLLFLIALLRYNLQTIKVISFKGHKFHGFQSIYRVLQPLLQSVPQKEIRYPFAVSPFLPSPGPP